jgi:hypothetical protein
VNLLLGRLRKSLGSPASATCFPADRTGILVAVKHFLTVTLLMFSPIMAAAQTPSICRIKSWKKGTAQADAQTLQIALSTTNRTYRKIINDVSGHPLYRLLVQPAGFIGVADGVVAWHVYLTSLDSSENLLLPSNSLEQEEYEGPDYLWWFYAGKNHPVPLEARRVVQVEGSYVTLKAEDVKLTAGDELESMQLTITFSNTPPPAD